MQARRWSWLGVAVMVAGCGEGPQQAAAFATGTSGGTEPASPVASTDSTSTGGEDDTGPDDIKLDVGASVDMGEPPPSQASCDDLEDLPTNQGCEFWAVDLPNVSQAPLNTAPHDQQFAVVVTNSLPEQSANIEIFVGDNDDALESGVLPPSTMRVFQLPSMNIPPGTTSDAGTAYRVKADIPITAYQFQPLDNTSPVYSNDATILFPTHVLGADYTAITGDATLASADAFSSSDANTGAFVSIVATEDDTTVTLFPTAALHAGAVNDVVLDRGQVLTAISSERGAPTFGNLSGSRVVADAPVAVFSGSVATSEPSGANTPCCADHLEHQMLPLTAWGTAYVAAPAASAVDSGDDASLFRITGAADGTALEYNPAAPAGAPSSIDAYETVAFVTDAPFAVRSTGDEPFALTQFLLSNHYFPSLARPGDPSMMLLAAVEQFQDRYVFLMPHGYDTSVVTIVAPLAAQITLDGVAVPPVSTPAGSVANADYGYAHIDAAAGPHVMEADVPFGIIASGHANDVSFGYVGGSGVAKIAEPPPPPAG